MPMNFCNAVAAPFLVCMQNHFRIAVAIKLVPFGFQFFFYFGIIINFAVES